MRPSAEKRVADGAQWRQCPACRGGIDDHSDAVQALFDAAIRTDLFLSLPDDLTQLNAQDTPRIARVQSCQSTEAAIADRASAISTPTTMPPISLKKNLRPPVTALFRVAGSLSPCFRVPGWQVGDVDWMAGARKVHAKPAAGFPTRDQVSMTHEIHQGTTATSKTPSARVEISPKSMVIAVLVLAAGWLLIRLVPAIMVLLVALMIVGTMNPAVRWLQARAIRRGISIGIVFGGLLLVCIGMAALTIPALITQVSSLIEQEPALRANLVEFLGRYRPTEFLGVALRDLHYEVLATGAASDMLAASGRLIEIVAYGVGAFFLAMYMMIDGDRLRGVLFLATPRAQHIRLSRVLLNLETIVGGYIRGQLITSLLMGGFMFVLLTLCGVPNALALATFGGLADVLPFVGIFLTMVPALLASLSQGVFITMIVLVLMLCYEEFESRVVVPVVYGRALRLPSSVVLFALIAGGTLAGIGGALLALPVAATILMLIDELRMHMPGEDVQRDDVEIQQQDQRSEAEYQRRTQGMPAEQAAAVAVEISHAQKKERNEAPRRPNS